MKQDGTPEEGDLFLREGIRLTLQKTGDVLDCFAGDVGWLTEVDGRPSWEFRKAPDNLIPCMEMQWISLGPDQIRRGLRSKAMKDAKASDHVVELVSRTYEFKVCSCFHDPSLQWLLRSERVLRRIHPKLGVLDKIVDALEVSE